MTSPANAAQRAGNRPAVPRELSVFINCPFDAEYALLFDAIVFAITSCGFTPRCAFESGTVSVPRLSQIYEVLSSSKYSIHDLTRCRGEGDANLARFNMPLELGIALGKGYSAPDIHDWLVLVPRGHSYKRFASDLNGHDFPEHDNTVELVVNHVVPWLAMRPECIYFHTATTDEVLSALPEFEKKLRELRAKWRNYPPWHLVVESARDVCGTAGFPQRPAQT